MITKKCTKCKIEKELKNFNKKYKNRLNSRCKECVRESVKKHYLNNKEYYINKALKHNKKYKLINKQFVWNFLKTHPCVDCNESDPIVLEFDHLKEKNNDISSMISQSYSLETIKKEIEKCEVRCANCHRRKTAKQFNWCKNNF
jgi:L-lysine 2,3-aminomutase